MTILSTADIGIAISDLLENQEIECLDWNNGEPADNPPHSKALIHTVDVSDPHNPLLYTEDAVFKVVIIRVG